MPGMPGISTAIKPIPDEIGVARLAGEPVMKTSVRGFEGRSPECA